jgi:uncharacterized coiled-coil protein SlyX
MNERLNAIVGARIAEFKRKMADVKKTAATIPRRVVVDVDARVDKFQKKLNKIATTMRSFGEVAGSSVRGGLISLLPTLSPIIGSLAGGLGGLASSFTALGGGLGAFGIAAIGNAQKLGENMSEIQKLNERIKSERQSLDPNQEKINELLHEREHIMGEMGKAQKSAMKQVNQFKTAWQDFLNATQEPVFRVFSAGLKTASSLLKEIRPIIKPIADVLVNLLNQFNQFSKTKQFQSFINFFATRGSKALQNWGQIAGNIFVGFMEMMKAFGPLGADMEKGLIGMTERFAEWAAGLSESKAFQNFINFVKTNGPKVLNLIGNLTTFLIELGKGMAPIGSWLLDMVNGFLSWATSMMKANPWIGKLIAGFITFLGMVIAILPNILLFGTLFSGVGKVIGKVIPFVKKAWTWVGTKLLSAFVRVLPWITRMGSFVLRLSGPIGWLISAAIMLAAAIIANWDKVWGTTKKIWNKVTGVISNKAEEIWDTITGTWNNVMDFFEGINLYESGKAIIQSAIDGILAMKNKVVGAVEGVVSKIRDFWPFSPAKVGPLSDLNKMDFAGPVTDSIARSKTAVQRAMTDMMAMPQMATVNVGAVSAPNLDRSANSGSSGGNSTTTNNFERMLEGAIFNVREDADIDRIAEALSEKVATGSRY